MGIGEIADCRIGDGVRLNQIICGLFSLLTRICFEG
jgi:hypothetical protein